MRAFVKNQNVRLSLFFAKINHLFGMRHKLRV